MECVLIWQAIEAAEIDISAHRVMVPLGWFHPFEFPVKDESFVVVDQEYSLSAVVVLLDFTVSPFELVDDWFQYKTKTTA